MSLRAVGTGTEQMLGVWVAIVKPRALQRQ